MPTEQLILRRVFPVPVTFADLRRAYADADAAWSRAAVVFKTEWHAAIKEATGAIDEVYAVIDGHEVRVAIVEGPGGTRNSVGPAVRSRDILDLLIKADEAGYWQRPHEVRHVLEESQMSHKTMASIAANSIAAAGGK